MALIKNGEVVQNDPWTYVSSDQDAPQNGPIIVELERWQSERESLIKRNEPVGLLLRAGQSPVDVADDIHRFSVIALDFPAFKDGRAYSYATRLRDQFGYAGEIRAIGNVLADQFHFMKRCGFDTFDIAKDSDLKLWQQVQSAISVAYQGANDDMVPVMSLRQRRKEAMRARAS